MGDYKSIEKELLGIGQAKLQDIVFQIIDKKYNPTNIVNLGGASGVQTTRKGTPDVSIQLSNGGYIFVEITIQKNQLLNKIKADIAKCKEKAKELLEKNAHVINVIFACVGKLDTLEMQECQNLCKEFCLDEKSPFVFWGLDKLCTLLLNEYQLIAVSELNFKFSHGLVKTLDVYLRDNEFDVSQKHEFLFREDELLDIKNKLFEKNIVLLNGVAGCGKTRLCIHLAQQLKLNGQIKEIYFVDKAYYNSFDSLCSLVGQENTMIILDDINRLPFIKEFIAYVQNHKNIYVLATVRDYALNSIVTDLKNNCLDKFLHFVCINPLTKEQQESIIEKIIPNVSFDTLSAIHNVAHENLRFAIMMAEVIQKEGYLPTKMKDLMERHFKRVNADLENVITKDENSIYLKSLVVLSFFHRIVVEEETNNWITISEALNKLGIHRDKFLDAMQFWDRREVVNISLEGKVYEIGDQILSSYLFYKLVFEEKQILLSEMFELFFPQYRKCFVDMFNSLLPAYGYKNETISQQLTQIWNGIYKTKNNNESIQFVSVFYRLLPIESLDFIKNHGVTFSEKLIDVLCGFESSSYYNLAIDILLNYIDNHNLEKDIVEKITEAFSIHKHSFSCNLNSQKYILNGLSERLSNNEVCRKLFISLSSKLLDITFYSTELKANTMVSFMIEAKPCECLLELRTIIWKGLIKLYNDGYYKPINKLLEWFRFFPNSKKIEHYEKIFNNDKKTIVPFVGTQLTKPLSFIQKTTLKKLLETCCSDKDDDYQKLVQTLEDESVEFKIYSQVFSRNREKRINWHSETNKYDKIFDMINIPEDFFAYVSSLHSIDVDINIISSIVKTYFIYIDKNFPKLFIDHLKKFIYEFKDLDIYYEEMSHIIAERYNLKEVIAFVRDSFSSKKGLILLELLQNLKCTDISNDLYELCITTFKEEYCKHNVNTSRVLKLSKFLEYEKFKHGFILKIFQMIQDSKNTNIEKYEVIKDFYYCIELKGLVFKDYTIEQIEMFFGNKLESVFYEMFFVLIQLNIIDLSKDFVYHIASKNIEYLYRYYDFYFQHDSEYVKFDYLDIHVLSRFPNVAQNMLVIYERSKKLSKYVIPVFEMEHIMSANFNDQTFSEFSELFIEKYISEVKDLDYMASFVSSLKSDWQIIFVKTLISKNINIEIFKQIRIFGHPWSWSGSAVSMYGKIIETIDTFLKDETTTIDNLSYITSIKERRDELVKCQFREKLRELSDYSYFA